MFNCTVTINLPDDTEIERRWAVDDLQDMFMQILYEWPNHTSLVIVFSNPFKVL